MGRCVECMAYGMAVAWLWRGCGVAGSSGKAGKRMKSALQLGGLGGSSCLLEAPGKIHFQTPRLPPEPYLHGFMTKEVLTRIMPNYKGLSLLSLSLLFLHPPVLSFLLFYLLHGSNDFSE